VTRTKRSKQSRGTDHVVTRVESRESLAAWMNDVGKCLNLSGEVVVLVMCRGVRIVNLPDRFGVRRTRTCAVMTVTTLSVTVLKEIQTPGFVYVCYLMGT
jgi:hypothetical protein